MKIKIQGYADENEYHWLKIVIIHWLMQYGGKKLTGKLLTMGKSQRKEKWLVRRFHMSQSNSEVAGSNPVLGKNCLCSPYGAWSVMSPGHFFELFIYPILSGLFPHPLLPPLHIVPYYKTVYFGLGGNALSFIFFFQTPSFYRSMSPFSSINPSSHSPPLPSPPTHRHEVTQTITPRRFQFSR